MGEAMVSFMLRSNLNAWIYLPARGLRYVVARIEASVSKYYYKRDVTRRSPVICKEKVIFKRTNYT